VPDLDGDEEKKILGGVYNSVFRQSIGITSVTIFMYYHSSLNSCNFIEFIFFGFNLVIIQTLYTTHAKAARAGSSSSSIARRGVCGSPLAPRPGRGGG
jgi:hypothetical protein